MCTCRHKQGRLACGKSSQATPNTPARATAAAAWAGASAAQMPACRAAARLTLSCTQQQPVRGRGRGNQQTRRRHRECACAVVPGGSSGFVSQVSSLPHCLLTGLHRHSHLSKASISPGIAVCDRPSSPACRPCSSTGVQAGQQQQQVGQQASRVALNHCIVVAGTPACSHHCPQLPVAVPGSPPVVRGGR